MRNFLLLVFLLLSFSSVYSQNKPTTKQQKEFKMPSGVTRKDYLPNVVVVKFKASALPSDGKAAMQKGAAPVIKSIKAELVSLKQKFPKKSGKSTLAAAGKESEIGLERIYELRYSGNESVEQIINQLLRDDAIEYAEPKYIYRRDYTPNDPLFVSRDQYYLEQVKAPQAWDLIRNSSSVIIGIVDSGSDFDHPDLAANILLNAADPVNGVDDDLDGYVDNYRGWDFIGRSASLVKEDNNPAVTSDTTDHGVHVSGLASSVSDNGIGIGSIAFNARLLIVKTAADDDGSNIFAGYEGVKYAVDHGAQIVNCSWGGPGESAFGKDVVNYALGKGCMIVASSGNNNSSQLNYPAAYPGVFAVANVRSDDVRNGSSNYGSYIAISAPGTNILSTGYNNSYKSYSGTSMAAPLVASAAALVKARFPHLSMQQVGEKLRATADNIDPRNPGFAGKLGRGRLNVYRALTESIPSIRRERLIVQDNGYGSRPPGDTLTLFFDLKNHLDPAVNVSITLSSTGSAVSVLNPTLTIASFNTGYLMTNVGPFKVVISKAVSDNAVVDFRLDYRANNGTYVDSETFNLQVALDYLNVQVNAISTTMSSNGRLGFSGADGTNGLGLIYKGQQLLYEASLMIGNSPVKISNNVRLGSSGSSEDFVKIQRARFISNSPADFEGRALFNDNGSESPLNIHVKYRQVAFAGSQNKYVIAEYKVVNKGTAPLNGVYVGLFTDWDIDKASNNITKYDAANRLGYTYSTNPAAAYAGVKVLSAKGAGTYYPLSYSLPGDLLENGSFTRAEKFETLSSGIKATGLGSDSPSGYDVMFVIGDGPFNIPASDSAKVAFAFIAADNLNDIQESARAAESGYQAFLLAESRRLITSDIRISNFPNPVSRKTTIEFSVPMKGLVSLNLFNLQGQKIKTLIDRQSYARGIYQLDLDMEDLQSGIYICKLRFNNQEKARKVALIK